MGNRNYQTVFSLVLIVLLGSQWLTPFHLGMGEMARSAHTEHSTHGQSSSMSMSFPHSCCKQNDVGLSFHGDLCCGACPALPGTIADFCSYTPSLFFIACEPQNQDSVFLVSLWHPPTL